MVEYTYDSWGKLLSTTGSLAETFGTEQPFRYRGYVYDEETGFYYLQSRYYNPELGRFISADVYLSTGQGVLGHNAYAYCLNNPISCQDGAGCRASHLTDVMLYDNLQPPKPPHRCISYNEYIDAQESFEGSDLSFGLWGNIADNGCGLVALHNLNVAAGRYAEFGELYLDIKTNYCATWLLGGLTGTFPLTIEKYLVSNYGRENVYNVKIDSNETFDAIIVLYAHSEGGHYFTGVNIGGGIYKTYNQRGFVGDIASIYNEVIKKGFQSGTNSLYYIWGVNFR